MPETVPAHSSDTEKGNICIHCGLCCDGSLFGKAVIGKEDDPAFLCELGVEVISKQDKRFFIQPCIWLKDRSCTLYHDHRRFKTCKNFQCKLLQRYLAAEISYDAALATIREVLTRRQSVKELAAAMQLQADSRILTTIRELKLSSTMDDLAFRRAYARQLLDSVVLGNLVSQKFYKEEGTRAELCPSEELQG